MPNTRLEKVNAGLYKEGSWEWPKRPQFVFVTLKNVRVSRGLAIDRPETSFLGLSKNKVSEAVTEKNESTKGKDGTTSARDEPGNKYFESFDWRVTATGYLDTKIGLIRKDGTLTGPGEVFDRTDVILLPAIPTRDSDTDKIKASGALFYSDARFERKADPYLTLELYIPASPLQQLCEELVSGRLSNLTVGVFVDVFQAEHVAVEPPMRPWYYIEEEGTFLNAAYLSSLDAHRHIPTTTTDDLEDLSLEAEETPEDFAEKYTRQKSGAQKFFESLGMILVAAGAVIAIWQFYDDPAQLPVPFLLAGIGFLLFMLVAYAEGILVDLEYLQRIVKERRKRRE